jgi:hypothetical protein
VGKGPDGLKSGRTGANLRLMRKNLISIIAGVISTGLLVGTASAGGQSGTIGVGAEQDLRGVGGVSLNFDGGMFHAGGFLGFSDDFNNDDTTAFEVGGRFYYHLHSTAMSDFGVGAQLGLFNVDSPGEANDGTGIFIQPGFQIRMFVASNVALSASGGINIAAGDSDGIIVEGDLVGGAGIHYYFF